MAVVSHVENDLLKVLPAKRAAAMPGRIKSSRISIISSLRRTLCSKSIVLLKSSVGISFPIDGS